MTEPIPTHQKAAALEASNQERLVDLMQGKVGLPVQFPPNTLESMRTIVYLETLLDSSGLLAKAKYKYHLALAEQLDDVEQASREARLTHGTGVFQPGAPPT